jgi:hypothetical protein
MQDNSLQLTIYNLVIISYLFLTDFSSDWLRIRLSVHFPLELIMLIVSPTSINYELIMVNCNWNGLNHNVFCIRYTSAEVHHCVLLQVFCALVPREIWHTCYPIDSLCFDYLYFFTPICTYIFIISSYFPCNCTHTNLTPCHIFLLCSVSPSLTPVGEIGATNPS